MKDLFNKAPLQAKFKPVLTRGVYIGINYTNVSDITDFFRIDESIPLLVVIRVLSKVELISLLVSQFNDNNINKALGDDCYRKCISLVSVFEIENVYTLRSIKSCMLKLNDYIIDNAGHYFSANQPKAGTDRYLNNLLEINLTNLLEEKL